MSRSYNRRPSVAAGIVLSACVLVGVASVTPARGQQPDAAALAALKAAYRRPAARPVESPALVHLGRHAFWDPRLSGSGTTACVTCHAPHLGWATTEAKSRTDAGGLTPRKSQTLLGVGHVAGPTFHWDGRLPSLEAQVKGAVLAGGMSRPGVGAEVIERRFQAVPAYVALFQEALPGSSITLDTLAQAVAAFERTLDPGLAPFDRWVDGDEAAVSEAARRGFVLFTGKANCALCHGGWRFTDDRFHDIGTTSTDPGRARALEPDDPQYALAQFAFKTPTLRGVSLRPPYMHDGSLPTLEAVVRHYETGGIARPSRSPLMRPLALTEQDRLDLVAFMQTLTGIATEAEAPPRLP